MRRVFTFSSMLIILFLLSGQVVHAEEESKRNRGLVGGLLKQVDSTVKETTKSVGTIVESTVKGTTKTVEDTVSFTKDAVETVVDPKQKKPVTSVVNKTVKHVGKTVENVTPVVENTTNTVNTVTGKVEDVVEELPDIPVVKKTVKEVGSAVNKTGKSVTRTVNKTVNKTSETVKELPVTETEAKQPTEKPVSKPNEKPESPTTPSQPTPTEKPVTPATPDKEVVEQENSTEVEVEPTKELSVNQKKETETVEVVEEEMNSQVNEPMPLIDETAVEVSSNPTTETASLNNEAKPQNSSTTKNIEQKHKTPTKPKQPTPMGYDNSVVMTKNTITISSPSIATSSVTDYPMAADSWQVVDQKLEGRQWIHSSEIMRNQWTNAPPGQPPQQTPFLKVHQN